jgi:hypothetical protein
MMIPSLLSKVPQKNCRVASPQFLASKSDRFGFRFTLPLLPSYGYWLLPLVFSKNIGHCPAMAIGYWLFALVAAVLSQQPRCGRQNTHHESLSHRA